MQKILLIVESPAKCKKIESFLGNDYKCIASYGHLRKLDNLNSIDINNNFNTKYSIINETIKLKQIEIIKKEIKNAKEVILATDDDREGEAIAWHICDLFNLPINNTKRIIFHEISLKALQFAVLHPTYINLNIINAQKARQVLDLLVGYTLSPILWNCFSKKYKNSLSAGRCQTSALRLLYDNYLEIKNNKNSKIVYNTVGYFTNKNIIFELNIQFETEDELLEFLNISVNYDHQFKLSEPKLSSYSSPLPLITSTLQQISSNELHMSPKETMKYAQELYENGLITYMRTDNKKYSLDFIKDVKNFILNTYNNIEYINKNLENISLNENLNNVNEINNNKNNNNENISLEAHEAIRPVNIFLKGNDINDKLKLNLNAKAIKLYNLIWKRSLESCMSDCTFNYINAEISACKGIFKYKCDQIIFPGWKIIENKIMDNNSTYLYLQSIKQGLILNYNKIISNITVKNNILHYTEAKLISILEEKEIGRPSTYSSLIEKIQERKYVNKENVKGLKIECKDFELEGEVLSEIKCVKEFGNEKNKLVIQPLGIAVIEFLIKNFNNLFEYNYTKNMEKDLDDIAIGNKNYNDICLKIYNELENLTKNVEKKKYEIKIDENNIYIIGKNGPVIKEIINEKVIFKSIKKDIDIKKLENGEYKIDDLIEEKLLNEKIVGNYKGEKLILKKGKYGLFVEWGINKKSLKEFGNRPIENIEYKDIIKILEKDNLLNLDKPVGLIRELTQNVSIRTGQYGDYIFYKNKKMKKPAFYKLSGFKENYKACDINDLKKWIVDTYHIDI